MLIIAAAQSQCAAADPQLLELTGDLGVHDPCIMKAGDTYYLVATGGRRGRGIVPIHTSSDLREWTRAGFVLERLPDWVSEEVPRARNAWAPDISYFNGKYHLYYSLSSFGVNNSAIALTTNRTLDPKSPDYEWIDEGLVVRSRAGEDDFNAIDPNLVIEDEKNVWLAWGSFWGGIMMRRIDPQTGKLSTEVATLHKIAARARNDEHKTPPVDGAIEAPFIVRRGGHWYHFVSWDFCCRGARSNYKVVVGRSANVTGPYVDKDGKPMSEGGGTLLIEAATDQWRGAGHPAVYQENGADYLLFHAYSADNGRSRLHVSTIEWEDGWPKVAKLP
ncbi:MAG TPA: family 43 glycosylhydrolase [Lacipirellulaceae bacterium]|nr:family 43 glycosylhydrolase [Lacipirellulaceae bacterium]